MPDDITDAELKDVADIVSQKVYSQSGVTCHQCRQKTTDMKTICRSVVGVSLKNRYGEDAQEALKNPEWWCTTGPLTWLCQEKGFQIPIIDYDEE